ncbi:phosphatase PAP2 family protein [Variovorax arabinosiphilus]|nr:phosphatase PAP2 family protein [Variovorax sp. J2R1-6]MDM0233316.1 phosphatase PAP2 family protein [Variovorax sp. J2R1-6]
MVDALIQAREATVLLEDATSYAPPLPAIGAVHPIERWEPWVRAYVAVGELLRGIDFGFTGTAASVQFTGASGVQATIATIERPRTATFEKQLALVASWADLRSERATEIMAQIDPQYAFWSSIVYMHPARTRRTFELINVLLQLCVYIEMRLKHALGCWRPVEYNPQIQPMITTPGHGSFPSGHATQAHAVAHMLGRLLDLDARHVTVTGQLARQAARIATNRVVAGVHFPVDSMAGRMLGVAIAEFFEARCGAASSFMHRTFNATFADDHPSTDFNPFHAQQDLAGNQFYSGAVNGSAVETPLLAALWSSAAQEWSGLFGDLP